jgi:hypothetical protein
LVVTLQEVETLVTVPEVNEEIPRDAVTADIKFSSRT